MSSKRGDKGVKLRRKALNLPLAEIRESNSTRRLIEMNRMIQKKVASRG